MEILKYLIAAVDLVIAILFIIALAFQGKEDKNNGGFVLCMTLILLPAVNMVCILCP